MTSSTSGLRIDFRSPSPQHSGTVASAHHYTSGSRVHFDGKPASVPLLPETGPEQALLLLEAEWQQRLDEPLRVLADFEVQLMDALDSVEASLTVNGAPC